jgi:hypothetical protein
MSSMLEGGITLGHPKKMFWFSDNGFKKRAR